jgi:hypothetical protein
MVIASVRAQSQPARMIADLITLFHFSVSAAKYLAAASGVPRYQRRA